MAVIARRLSDSGLLYAGEKPFSVRTIGEEAAAAVETLGQEVIWPLIRR